MAKFNVLIVDDDDMVRAQLATLLSSAGYNVHHLPSAIGVTRAVVEHRIDVVVVDIMMPSLPGDKLASLLRQNRRFSELGVVLISGRPAGELEVIAKQVEADGVVTKADLRTKLVPAIEAAAKLRRRT